MADVEFTTNPRVSGAEFVRASTRAQADAQTDGEEERDLVSVIEEALEEERTRLMLANSMLGCVQIALDPEAVSVAPAIYLESWPFFRYVEEAGRFANHCPHCDAEQEDMYLHSEPDQPFFCIARAPAGSIRLTALVGQIQLSGDESFEI